MSQYIMQVMEILGTIAFAMSGAYVAIQHKMDILGVVMLGMTTAVGGGIIRDLLIGQTPPVSLQNPLYALIAVGVSLIMFIPALRTHVPMDSGWMVLIDAVGLGAFTVVGCDAALAYNNLPMQLFLGVLTGVGGGVLRDIFTARPPVIFVKNFYALASLSGAVVYSLLLPAGGSLATICGILVTIVLRLLAARYHWHLPRA